MWDMKLHGGRDCAGEQKFLSLKEHPISAKGKYGRNPAKKEKEKEQGL